MKYKKKQSCDFKTISPFFSQCIILQLNIFNYLKKISFLHIYILLSPGMQQNNFLIHDWVM